MSLSNKTLADCVALILAAGRGHRFGSSTPKQYLKINGQSILARSIRIISSHPRIKSIRVVIHPDDKLLYEETTADLNLLKPIFGGPERQDSVRLGLESFKKVKPKFVLIHDAVRPFITEQIINDILFSLERKTKAVIPGLMIKDSIKRVHDKIVTTSVDRTNLWQAQTPQGFNFQTIIKAHEAAKGLKFTDDAAIAELSGIKVEVIEGNHDNFKITTSQDLERGKQLLNSKGGNNILRVGIGSDVHRFKKGTAIVLCGVKIPFSKSLEGHSDADVAMHAITDAILGAVGAGDIGVHFPPSEPKWKNSSSEVFLNHAANKVKHHQGQIINIDLTVICEKPKINAYRSQMQKKIASILKISSEKVNIKAIKSPIITDAVTANVKYVNHLPMLEIFLEKSCLSSLKSLQVK